MGVHRRFRATVEVGWREAYMCLHTLSSTRLEHRSFLAHGQTLCRSMFPVFVLSFEHNQHHRHNYAPITNRTLHHDQTRTQCTTPIGRCNIESRSHRYAGPKLAPRADLFRRTSRALPTLPTTLHRQVQVGRADDPTIYQEISRCLKPGADRIFATKVRPWL